MPRSRLKDDAVFPRPLRREIVALICVKVLVLAGLYWAFFTPARVDTTSTVETHILASGPAAKEE
jgi:hypothetical protein